MKKYLLPLFASFLIVGVASAFQPATLFLETWNGIKKQAVYSQEQADKLFKDGYKLFQGEALGGVAYTTISGSDTMKNFPTVYNANNALFDAGKIDVGTTSVASITTLSNLATVGTITSGVWSGTAINVNKGGTGSTTLAQHQVLIGSSTNAVGVVAGVGTDGQVLTSQGSGLPPNWESTVIDTSQNYDWTGTHTGIGIVGEIIAYASSTVPTGFLACNGQTVATLDYANLFALLGYTYGGSGANFLLPDLRGRNIIGYGTTTDLTIDAMGETGGATSTVLTIPQMPSHTHSFQAITNTPTANGPTGAGTPTTKDTTNNTSSTGGDQPHPNMDPFIVLQYIIKF